MNVVLAVAWLSANLLESQFGEEAGPAGWMTMSGQVCRCDPLSNFSGASWSCFHIASSRDFSGIVSTIAVSTFFFFF